MRHIIELFVADHCPGCPDARARVREFAARRPNVVVIERNVGIAQACDVALRYGLFATPAIVIDGRAVLYGTPTLSQLTARCEEGARAAT